MTTLREWRSRLLNTVRPRRGTADLEEELRLHVDLATEDERNAAVRPQMHAGWRWYGWAVQRRH